MEPTADQENTKAALADDVLKGADAIAEFLFGRDDPTRNRRRVYYLAQRCKLPIFRFGAVLHARKSTLMEFIAGQETKALIPPEDSAAEGNAAEPASAGTAEGDAGEPVPATS